MQQTNRYKLNLIDKADTFSPDPLNENTEKLEAQLAAEAQARAAADSAETKARADAVAAEAKARADADASEASTRAAADTAEVKNRTAAVSAEAQARADADASEASARAAADTALDSRIKTLEAHKLATGQYKGNGVSGRVINLGFKPSAVLLVSTTTNTMISSMAVTGHDGRGLIIVNNGFQINAENLNDGLITYNYVACL